MFQGLPAEELARLERAAMPVTPASGAQVFAQSDPSDAVYAVTGGEGHVYIGSIHRQSKGLMVELFRRGDIFGEIGVIDGGPRTAEAVVDGRVELARISGSAFLAALRSCAPLGANLVTMLTRRLRRTFQLLQDATFEPLDVRLARQVLYLAEVNGRRTEGGLRISGRLRQSDLANLLGATPRSIITILNQWRADGTVTYDGNRALLTLCRVDRLKRLMEGEE